MIALTTVRRNDYKALLKEGSRDLSDLPELYGAGWMFRLQGILCATAVRQCAEDAAIEGYGYDNAKELMELVERFHYDEIFEDNGLERFKPGPTTLKAMLYSMCEAETGDYGRECRCPMNSRSRSSSRTTGASSSASGTITRTTPPSYPVRAAEGRP